jgi:hypothetical protein
MKGEKGDRGRKPRETNTYIKESRAKIRGWKEALEKKGIKKEEMHSLRNKISALESRIQKRLELRGLKEKIESRRQRFEELADIIASSSCNPCSGDLLGEIKNSLPITSLQCPVPETL